MHGSTVVLIAALTLPPPGASHFERAHADTVTTVRSVGSVQLPVRPDLAVITFTLTSIGRSPAEAGAAVAARTDSLRSALMALDVPEDSLVVGSRWRWWPNRIRESVVNRGCIPDVSGSGCRNVVDTSYTAEESVQARIRELSVLGAVIDAALELRVFQMTDVAFSRTDDREVRDRALAQAAARARARAEGIAGALGLELGRLVSVSDEPPATSDPWGLSPVLTMGSAAAGGATQVTVPTLTVRADVWTVWTAVAPGERRPGR